MNAADLARCRARLEERRVELRALSAGSAAARKPVELDQQSVGRLSRQDALQQQAMANAREARRVAELKRIEAALKRIGNEEFGWCEACGEAIAPKRLDIDPTTAYCAQCAGALKR